MAIPNKIKNAMLAGNDGRYLYTVQSIGHIDSVQFASGPNGMALGCPIAGRDVGGIVSDILTIVIETVELRSNYCLLQGHYSTYTRKDKGLRLAASNIYKGLIIDLRTHSETPSHKALRERCEKECESPRLLPRTRLVIQERVVAELGVVLMENQYKHVL